MPSRSKQHYQAARPPRAVPQPGERLQKVLAAAGIGSRRECEQLILDGRVEIDRQVVRELGTRVEASEHEVRVDGVPLATKRRVYFLLNKPPGVVTTNRDPDGRPRAIDLIRTDERLFPVGRLDMSSEGLILMTNDGEMANRLAHPRYGVEKTYYVRVAGDPARDMLEKLKAGVHLAEGVVRVGDVKVKKRHRQSTELEIVLKEGKNREIRRLLAAVGHKVLTLRRVAIGPLRLGELPTGAYRQLAPDEVRNIERFLKHGKTPRGKPGRSGKRPFAKPEPRSPERPAAGGRDSRRPRGRPETKQGTVLTGERPRANAPRFGQGSDLRRKRPKGKRHP